MKNFKLGIILASVFLLSACGNPDQNGQSQVDEEDIQLLDETESLSNEISAANDSMEQKLNELETTLESLNN